MKTAGAAVDNEGLGGRGARLELGSRVLLVATSHTGNNVFCTPAIHLLKSCYPATTFNVLSLNRTSADVFADNPDLERSFVAKGVHKFRRIARKHDQVICLHRKSNYLLEDLTVPHFLAPKTFRGPHAADHILRFVADYIGCDVRDADCAYVLGPAAQELPSALGDVNSGDVVIAFHLGVGRTAIHGWKFFYPNRATHRKRWDLDRYVALGLRLQQHNAQVRILLTGTRNEAFLGRQFSRQVPGTINMMGKTSVGDLVLLMQRLSLFIAQDSGVLHIASASEVPLLGLYGPTDPAKTGPYPEKPYRVVLKKNEMIDIQVDAVVDASIQLLERYPRSFGVPAGL